MILCRQKLLWPPSATSSASLSYSKQCTEPQPRGTKAALWLKTMSQRQNKQVQLLNIKYSVLITQNFALHFEEFKHLAVIPYLHIASFLVYPFYKVSVTCTGTWPCSNGFQEEGFVVRSCCSVILSEDKRPKLATGDKTVRRKQKYLWTWMQEFLI